MNSSREPLHQPPNPDDLRRVPPASPACAEVRGMLRDFADGDLSTAESAHVENHLTGCRVCAVELARAEHEVLRLRSFFGAARASAAGPGLRPGFANRVVERLVLDETSMISADAVARAVAAADAERLREREDARRIDSNTADAYAADSNAADASTRRKGAGHGRSVFAARGRFGLVLAVAASVLLVAGLVAMALLQRVEAAPKLVARLVVLEAEGAFDFGGRPLGAGSGVGERQSLLVGPGGEARIDWHDLSTGPQPAATLQLGAGRMRMESGAPRLLDGRVDVESHRPVSLSLGDGSQVDFGVGQYVVVAEAFADPLTGEAGADALPTDGSSLQDAPTSLKVRVETLSGDPAAIVVAGRGPAFVAAGRAGVYQTNGPVVVTSGGGVAVVPEPPARVEVPGGLDEQAMLIGHVQERSGMPNVGAQVYLQYASAGSMLVAARTTGSDGRFQITMDQAVTGDFAVVLALPAEVRRELGMVFPDAVRLVRNGQSTQFGTPLVFDLAAPVDGVVVDDLQQPLANVHVLPCVVDELFGGLQPLETLRAIAGADGRFRIERLPARLPPHHAMVLVSWRADLETTTVALPVRGGVLANELLAPIAMRPLQVVTLGSSSALFGNSQYDVFETLDQGDGLLPKGTAIRRRTVTTDGNGQVQNFHAGFGKIYVRRSNSPQVLVKQLVPSQVAPGPLVYGTALQPVPLVSVFQPMAPVTETDLELASSHRCRQIQVIPNENPVANQVLSVKDQLGRTVGGAQVFAVDGGLVQPNVRFLGFSSELGSLSLEPVRDSGDVVVVAADGSLAVVPLPSSQLGVATIDAPLHEPGRVLLAPPLRPADGRMVAVRFERLDLPLPGVHRFAIRLASETTGWEFQDLPAGTYKVYHHGEMHTLVVPSGGFVVLD